MTKRVFPVCALWSQLALMGCGAAPKEEASLSVKGEVTCLAFSPSGRAFVAGTFIRPFNDTSTVFGEIKVWETATRQELAALPQERKVQAVAYSPEGGLLAIASISLQGETVKLYEGTPPKEKAVLPTKGAVYALVFSPDGNTLAIADGWGLNKPLNVQLWDVATLKERLSLRGINSGGTKLAFSPDGTTLAVGDVDEGLAPAPAVVRLFDPVTGKQRTQFTSSYRSTVDGLVFFPDGKTLAVLHGSDGVSLWDASGEKAREVTKLPPGHYGSRTGLAVSPDGKLVATSGSLQGSDNYSDIRLWDVAAGKWRTTWKVDRTFFSTLAFSPNGKSLLAGGRTKSGEGVVKMWAVPE